MSPRLRRVLPYVLVGAIGAYLYYAAGQIHYEHRPGVIGPDFWPKLVLGAMIFICVWEIARLALAQGASPASGAAPVEAKPEEQAAAPPPERPVILVSGIALTVLYVWLLHVMGFFSATLPYLAAFIALGGYRRWGVIAAASSVGTVLMMFFFMKVVYISLPLGEGPFKEVTLFLMRVMGIR